MLLPRKQKKQFIKTLPKLDCTPAFAATEEELGFANPSGKTARPSRSRAGVRGGSSQKDCRQTRNMKV